MNKIEFHSHEQQDEFVYNLFNQKKDGFFLDISCGNPVIGSNSYALEKYCNWSGIGIDLRDCEQEFQWSKERTARFERIDATSDALTDFLKTNVPANTVVDYISLDVDAAGTNLAFKALEKVLAANIRFKAMTFEHEYYQHGDQIQNPARELLESHGYIRLFEDVRLWSGGTQDDSSWSFEDWWIDPQYFSQELIKNTKSNLYYFQCIEHLKKLQNNEYSATHRCSRGWPEEYDLFWNEDEKDQLKQLFKNYKERPAPMRVFDCFPFYNEFDLAELRIQELWDVVDYFVIAEANTTHQNNPKPFYLKDNWERFEKYASKIRHVMIEDMPMSPDTWVNERFQRHCLQRGLTDLQPNDIVITSDCDEIPRASIIDAIKEDTNNYDRYVLFVPLHYFKINYLMANPNGLHGNVMVARGRAYTDPQQERALTFPWTPKPTNYDVVYVNHGGWHFSYFGKTEFAVNKIKNFAHAETNRAEILDRMDVDKMIENHVGIGWEQGDERFVYTKVDDYYPRAILENPEKYKDMIIPQQDFSVYDFYPDIELTPENLQGHINGTFLSNYRRLVQL